MKARKLTHVTIISRDPLQGRLSGRDPDHLGFSRNAVAIILIGGIAWLAIAGVFADRLNLGSKGFFAIEVIYLVAVSIILYAVAEYSNVAVGRSQKLEQNASTEVVRRLAQVAALHDGETALHCERIGALAYELALELGLSESHCVTLRQAAVLHDLGKIGVDRSILLKPGPLSDEERDEVRRHVPLGAALLEGAEHPVLNLALVAIKTHHEWWDGRGYPRGLSGEAIPVEGRIVAVCDVFDALATDRPYREALAPCHALSIVQEASGAQFDPSIVTAFERCFPRLREMYDSRSVSAVSA